MVIYLFLLLSMGVDPRNQNLFFRLGGRSLYSWNILLDYLVFFSFIKAIWHF